MHCEFVPLSSYDWALATQHEGSGQPPCILPWNPTVYCVVVAFHSTTLWMTVELTMQLFFTFKRRSTLYFWSMLSTTWGIALITVGFELSLFTRANQYLVETLIATGWVAMVTGFSIVLYSRLHLILHNRTVLRGVLIAIIVDGLIVHVPGVVAGYMGHRGKIVYKYASSLEIIFSAQEIALSTLYIYVFMKFVRECRSGPQIRTTLHLLVIAQIVVVISDTALCVLLYLNLFLARLMILPFVYAVKLKIEYVVLTRLVSFSRRSGHPHDADILSGLSPAPTTPGSHGNRSFAEKEKGSFSSKSVFNTTRSTSSNKILMAHDFEAVHWPPGSNPPRSDLGMAAHLPAVPQTCLSALPALAAPGFPSDVEFVGSVGVDHGEETFEEIERRYLGRFEMEGKCDSWTSLPGRISYASRGK